jgi:hypothetical protein
MDSCLRKAADYESYPYKSNIISADGKEIISLFVRVLVFWRANNELQHNPWEGLTPNNWGRLCQSTQLLIHV